MLCIDFLLHLILVCFDASLQGVGLLLQLVLLKLEQCLFLRCVKQLLLDFFNPVLKLLMASLYLLDTLVDLNLFTIDSVLVSLVIVALFP